MSISWKKLSLVIGVIILTSLMVGSIVWAVENTVIEEQKNQASLLENQVKDLSDQITKKLEEKKAKEEAEALAAAKAASGAGKTTQKSTKGGVPNSSEPEPVAGTETGSEPASEPETAPSPVIYYFYDPDCGACMYETPIVLELQSEGIPFNLMNVEDHPEYIGQYGLTHVPTFILNSTKVVAVYTKEELLNFWNTYK